MKTTMLVSLLIGLIGVTSAGQVRADGTVDWNRYYSHGESNAIMEAWVKRHPKFARLMTMG